MMLCQKLDKSDLPFFLSFARNQWIAEEKFDGDRIRLQIKDGQVKLFNRRGIEVTNRYPELLSLGGTSKLLDGEMCVMDENGVSQFNEGIAFRTHCQSPSSIQNAMERYPVTYVVFDILEASGQDLRASPLSHRREVLEDWFRGCGHPNIILSQFRHDIEDLWTEVTSKGGEGIILKKLDSPYLEGKRSSAWKKVKDIKEVDLRFNSYEVNPQGITVENPEGIRVLVAGRHQYDIRDTIDKEGSATITIRHLGQTKAGKFRQPTYMKQVF